MKNIFESGRSGYSSVVANYAEWGAQFNYTLPYNASGGSIVITDIIGEKIETLVLQSNQGSKLWDTRKLPIGVYLYTLKSVGLSETGKVVISR
ncbi:MAG: T9SS type A sorting domain-containing protein [Bacteroidales bacterium]|nr:T9SS type A sorting domain-containing protein [Bacteroidales bacterium]